MQELEKSLKERQTYAATLESQLREEIARSAPVYGSNLDRLSTVQLEQLTRLHERGLKQSRNLLVQPVINVDSLSHHLQSQKTPCSPIHRIVILQFTISIKIRFLIL